MRVAYKTIKILESDGLLIIKKKPNVVAWILPLICCFFGVLIFKDDWNKPLFWVLYIVLTAWLTFMCVAFDCFCKIVIDRNSKKFYIYNFCKETYDFDDVKQVKGYLDPVEEGLESCKLEIFLKNGYVACLYTNDKHQNEELSELLNSILFNK